MKRRHFLQFTGATLASLGLSQFRLAQTGQRLNQALAQGTGRKLALLVGVNEYLGDVRSLYGCVNDVALQRELLLHRYGFQPDDVMILTDETELKPTRANILQAFEQHLIGQAQPGDVVLFHYSGHGSLVQDATIPEFGGLNGTIVPRDGRVNLEGQQVQDITGKTLFLLMSALQTENVTVVLDSCHSGGGTRGNLVVRAISPSLSGGDALPSEEELAYQQEWMTRLGLSEEELQQRRRAGIAKGMAMGSAQIDQLAADAAFDGFNAGAFTYHLTQYLWQQPTVQPAPVTFNQLVFAIQNSTYIFQEPVLQMKPGSRLDSKPLYLLEPVAPAAEAVVRQQNGNQIDFWLGGISSNSLVNFNQGAVFDLIDATGRVVGEVEQVGRSGLVGQGRVRGTRSGTSIQSGMLLREQIRGLPTNLSLQVGLHESLGSDQAEARSQLELVSRIRVAPVDQRNNVDYLLGRMTETVIQQVRQQSARTIPEPNSIGLFSSSLLPVPDTFGTSNETVENAINRLRARLKMLLAGRILASVNNGSVSRLNVDVSIDPHDDQRSLQVASRGAYEAGNALLTTAQRSQQFVDGSQINLSIINREPQSVYVSALLIAENGDILLLHPLNWDESETATLVTTGQHITAPSSGRFITLRNKGFLEMVVLASTNPLRDTLRGLQRIAGNRGLRAGQPVLFEEDEPVEMIDSMLTDVSRGIGVVPIDDNPSAVSETASPVNTSRGIDSNQLAVISATLEVV